jgi:hypothetical protein
MIILHHPLNWTTLYLQVLALNIYRFSPKMRHGTGRGCKPAGCAGKCRNNVNWCPSLHAPWNASMVKFSVIIKYRINRQTFFPPNGLEWFAIFESSGRKKKEKDNGY